MLGQVSTRFVALGGCAGLNDCDRDWAGLGRGCAGALAACDDKVDKSDLFQHRGCGPQDQTDWQ